MDPHTDKTKNSRVNITVKEIEKHKNLFSFYKEKYQNKLSEIKETDQYAYFLKFKKTKEYEEFLKETERYIEKSKKDTIKKEDKTELKKSKKGISKKKENKELKKSKKDATKKNDS